MPDMSGWLAVKYGQIARGHDIAARQTELQGNLQNAQANNISDPFSASNQLQRANATHDIAQANQADMVTRLMPNESYYKNKLASAQADELKTTISGEVLRRFLQSRGITPPGGGSALSTPAAPAAPNVTMTRTSILDTPSGSQLPTYSLPTPDLFMQKYAAGTERVPGQGSPTVDKVPAVLAPGEAVLNAPAADFAGRGLIALLNSWGRQKMGMD